MRRWWTQSCDVEDVPILPEEEQLFIREVDNGGAFYCVGDAGDKKI